MRKQIDMLDVMRAVTLLIGERFPRYPVNNRDIDEGFPRPSAFVDISDISSEMISATLEQETAQISLYFFEETIYAGFLRCLELKSAVVDMLLAPIVVTSETGHTEHVVPSDVKALVSKADKALQVDFTVEVRTVHDLFGDDADLPVMEDLEQRSEQPPVLLDAGTGDAADMGQISGGIMPVGTAQSSQ